MTHHDDSSRSIPMNHADPSSWITTMNHDDSSWWMIIMQHRDESWWVIMMKHDDSPLWSTVRPWKDSFQGFMVFFAMGTMTFFQSAFVPWLLFAMAPMHLSSLFAKAPMPFSILRPSKWKSETARWQHKSQLSDHPHKLWNFWMNSILGLGAKLRGRELLICRVAERIISNTVTRMCFYTSWWTNPNVVSPAKMIITARTASELHTCV